MAVNVLGSPHKMPHLHDLPDLVIDKILGFLPTKAAVQATFLSKQSAVSSASSLNFDEADDLRRHNLHGRVAYRQLHNKFINFLKGYLEYHEKYEKKEVLDTLRLHMKLYLCRDATVIDRWLERAINRGLKELDISPRHMVVKAKKMYRLPWVSFANNAQSLTSLNLEYVSMADIQSAKLQRDEKYLLPSLKTMSFEYVWFDDKALLSLLLECPSIKYLSLTECSFGDFMCRVSSSTLKNLQLKYCKRLRFVQVDDEAKNLESFTFVSSLPPNSRCEKVILNNTFNLKNITICVDDLGEFSLNGYHRTLKASINVQNLHLFDFLGSLKDHEFSVIGCQWAKIAVRELWFKNWFVHYSSHFPTLIGCLKEFGCCKKVSLYNQDLKALIIPNHFRKEFSSPLPKLCILEVRMPNPPTEASRDYFDLLDSLHWIAPSAKVEICKTATHRFDALSEEFRFPYVLY